MALIKQTTSTVYARDAVVLNLGDLQRQGVEIIEQARKRAEAIVREAQAERERLIAGAAEQGRQEGHARGSAEGLEQGKAAGRAAAMEELKPQLVALQASWAAALEAFLADRARMLHEAETDVLRLAVAIGERVTRRVVTLDPAVAAEQVRGVLGMIVRPTGLEIAIHPADRPVVEAALPDLVKRFPAVQHAELVDNAALERGSCVARTRGNRLSDGSESGSDSESVGAGEIDASIATQLDRIVEALLPGSSAQQNEAPGGATGAAPVTVLATQIDTLRLIQPVRITGRVSAIRGLVALVADLPLPVGSLVRVGDDGTSLGEVVGFDGRRAIVMMLGQLQGVRPGDGVVGLQAAQTVGVGSRLLGRCIDGLGRPIDGKGPALGLTPRPIDPPPLSALSRRRIVEPLYTGVRAIDLMTTLGRGQRMGIFAGPGVGKSTLLGSITRNATSDVNVVALIGERGREVRDFIEGSLGEEGLKRSVVVVSTSDESPLLRIRAAMVACAIAEHFRDRGQNVLLMMDSITRLAHAQRQVGLSVGEPPATRGYTPSVFSLMARLLERAGAMTQTPPGSDSKSGAVGDRIGGGGSITGLYTILVEGDDMTEPVADAARGILDGHLILSRTLAHKAHYPAIDVLDSISRVADDVCDATHIAARRQVVRLLAAYREVEDLIQIGAYAKGSSPEADIAIRYHAALLDLLRQGSKEVEPFDPARSRMVKLAVEAGAAFHQAAQQHAAAAGAPAQPRRA